MNSNQSASYSQFLTDFQPEHLEEFRASAISDDVLTLNFRSFDGDDENDREEAFLLLKNDPDHNNNGTLSGASQNNLANGLYHGCWVFQGHCGIIGKLNSPRKDKDGKPIKYESPRDVGVQLFIPHVSVRASYAIAENLGIDKEEYHKIRNLSAILLPDAVDEGFWDWFKTTKHFLLVTEASKNPCAIISAGFPAIGLSGIWGWAANEQIGGNWGKAQNEKGFPIKIIHPELLPFLNGREIIFALDCDNNRITELSTDEEIEKINKAVELGAKSKKSFYWTINSKDAKGKYPKTKFTEIKWKNGKGVDDWLGSIAESKRETELSKAIQNRSKIDTSKTPPPKEKNKSVLANEDTQEIAEKQGRIIEKLDLNVQRNDKGQIVSKLQQAIISLYVLFEDRVELNLMSGYIELDRQTLDLNNIKGFSSSKLGVDYSTETLVQAWHQLASANSYHPVKEYLNSLRGKIEPDGELLNNLSTFFFGNAEPLANVMLRKSLIATVARALEPGCKVDTLLVLQGKQGYCKSTFLKALASENWFCEDLRDIENKDELRKLTSSWILELAEVDYLIGKKEIEAFKRFLTTTVDEYRPPYGRSNVRSLRSCGLFATTNRDEFLNDSSKERSVDQPSSENEQSLHSPVIHSLTQKYGKLSSSTLEPATGKDYGCYSSFSDLSSLNSSTPKPATDKGFSATSLLEEMSSSDSEMSSSDIRSSEMSNRLISNSIPCQEPLQAEIAEKSSISDLEMSSSNISSGSGLQGAATQLSLKNAPKLATENFEIETSDESSDSSDYESDILEEC